MSTSLLYHAFGAINYRYLKTEYGKGQIVFHLEKKRHKQRCARCKSKRVNHNGSRCYPLKTVPIGGMPVVLVLHLKQLECKACGARLQEEREIADSRKTYTRKLARLVLDLAEKMTLQDVSQFLGMGWHQVRDIVKQDLEKRERQRSWRDVKVLAIDEIAVRKGHRYMTVIADLESGMVLDLVEGKHAEALAPVFEKLKRSGAQIEAIAADMSKAYKKAVRRYAPDAILVHDPFHVVQAVNRALDQVRRSEQNRLEKEGKKVIKKSRWLLLKAKEKLAEEPKRAKRLDALLDQNANLYKAYLLKEDLRQLWHKPNKADAELFLESWIEEAKATKLTPLKDLAGTLKRNAKAILAWYDRPITNGPMEGLNNKIKVLKRRAYGYRNLSFFRLLVLFIHQKQFRLSGT